MKYAIIENGIVTNVVKADADFAAAQGWVACDGTVHMGFAYDGTTFSDTAERQAKLLEAKTISARTQRDALLAETDWWVLPDRTVTQEQLDYRQALRDVPSQEGFPENVAWPVKP